MSASDRVRDALCRLDMAEGLGAVVARDDTAAMAAAAFLDDTERVGPLVGTGLTVKDWIDVAGMACEGESDRRTGRMPTRDATAVARLRAAGAIVIAKTQPGSQHPLHGRCVHPIDPRHSPGGSSSGEASLIGAGASLLGLGSDSGGSIRLPAAWCGAAGIKPSFGLVPATGHFPRVGPHNDGRTVIGPMARRVSDLIAALRTIAGPDGVDPGCVPAPLGDPSVVKPTGLRVAMFEGDGAWRPAVSTLAAVHRAGDVLAGLGAVVVDRKLPEHLDESLDITQRYWQRGALSGADADRQLRDWDRFVGMFTRAAANFDVVISPVVADVAPLERPLIGDDYIFTLAWSLTGWPAVSVPFGVDASTGLPLAVQVAAPRWHDHVALAVAKWLDDVALN